MEPTELFTRGIGEDTDIVNKEMYTFPDKKGRSLTLRPEGPPPSPAPTSPIICRRCRTPAPLLYRPHVPVRAAAEGAIPAVLSDRGRDPGPEEPAADVEMFSLLVDFLNRLEFTDLAVGLNSVGCEACRPGYRDALRAVLVAHKDELCVDCVRRIDTNPLRVLDCKEPSCQPVKAMLPSIGGHLCETCSAHLRFVEEGLQNLKIPYELNDRLVRGLDYYTRTVFEVVSGRLGAQNAICGGRTL